MARPAGRTHIASVKIMISPEDKADFFHACAENGEEASTAIRRFMTTYAVRTHSQRNPDASAENDGTPLNLSTMENCMVARS
jgi:hypothetical protein